MAVELKDTSSSRETLAVSQRKLLNVCFASFVSLSMFQQTVVAFSPLTSTGFVTSTHKHHNRLINRSSRHINICRQTPISLVSRSAVIQSYRVEDDPDVSSSDAFSFLPSRLSSIERLETPSEFKSVVMDEQDSLVVVRFSADTCPSCRSTSHLFRKWSRDNETPSNDGKLEVKVVEMPLNKATSAFMQDKLRVDQLPYCHLYHPKMGLVEEQLVMNKIDFRVFVDVVEKWAAGLATADYDSCILCSKDELIDDCQEFC